MDDRLKCFIDEFVNYYDTGPSRAMLRSIEAYMISQKDLHNVILDLACGDGFVNKQILKYKATVGYDLSITQLHMSKKNDQYKFLIQGNAGTLPFRDSSFPIIVSNSSIEHMVELINVLKEINRVLKPGGEFIFTVPTDRLSEWYWLSWLFSHLGMYKVAENFVRNYNRKRDHVNLFNEDIWLVMLRQAGFQKVYTQSYFDYKTTFVFTMLETLWMLTLPIPQIVGRQLKTKKINIPTCILLLLPKVLRQKIQVSLISKLLTSVSKFDGSHLFIVALK